MTPHMLMWLCLPHKVSHYSCKLLTHSLQRSEIKPLAFLSPLPQLVTVVRTQFCHRRLCVPFWHLSLRTDHSQITYFFLSYMYFYLRTFEIVIFVSLIKRYQLPLCIICYVLCYFLCTSDVPCIVVAQCFLKN